MLAPRSGARVNYWPFLELNFQWTPCPLCVAPPGWNWLFLGMLVIMASSRRPGKKVATSRQKKRTQSGNVPLAPPVRKGQTRRTKEGKAWYKKHTEATYFSDVCIDRDRLSREFPHILRRIRELGMEFIFADPKECNLHMVWEFYANWEPEARSHYVTVRGRNVPITPTDALMTGIELNIGAIMKSFMRKSRVHKGHMYAFGGLITKLCRVAGVPEENVDYLAPLYLAPLGEVEKHYPLNGHARGLLGIGPKFREPIENDISTNEENMRTSLDMGSDSKEEIDPAHADEEVDGGDAMED
ncbi:hypothetical protein H5410_057297 [Solanum commersonii]|uniref:Uncharacterized protein n=1 Tax=Solanum commersonii TaxID=4109 RepID=A0A9J5WMJ6_SOLCO|nr:hypothetical protein H5410_057297 [Solanum commersonii]